MAILDFLKSPFAEAGKTLFSGIGDIISKFKVDPTKALEYEQELKKLQLQLEESMAKIQIEAEAEVTKQIEAEQAAVSDRWKSDMASDSFLSKNARPIVLLSTVGFMFIIILANSMHIESIAAHFDVKPEYIDLLKYLLITIVAAYFGGRSYEKGKKIVT